MPRTFPTPSRRTLAALALTAATWPAWCATPAGADAPSTFAQENDAAMDRMMADMAITPSGDVDRDFAAMMIPHHQGAIDMAQLELRYGKNAQLKLLAQESIVDQIQEITMMRLALGEPLPAQISSPPQGTAHVSTAFGPSSN